MQLVDKHISLEELKKLSEKMSNNLVKAVVDIEKEIMIVDAALHSDEETALLEEGSLQKDVWGINLYPFKNESEWIEFDSMINIRPLQGNRSRNVDDPLIRKKIIKIVNTLVKR